MAIVESVVDLRGLHTKIVAGDGEACGQFYEYVFRRSSRIFRGLQNSEDLTDETALKATSRFGLFEPPEEVTAFDRAVNGWIRVIALNTKRDEFRRIGRHPRTVGLDEFVENTYQEPQQPEETSQNQSFLQDVLDQRAKKLLRPEYYSAVRLRMEGKKIPEIAGELGITEVNARVRLSRGRKRLVKEFIEPAGLVIAAKFGPYIRDAAYDGQIESVRFLGLHYVAPEVAEQYLQTKKADQELIENEGYLPASDVLSPSEYRILRKGQFEHLHHKIGGVLVIKPEEIVELKNLVVKIKPPKPRPPKPDYRRLTTFAETQHHYGILHHAARNGNLKAIKKGGFWWVEEQDVELFLKNRQSSTGSF